MTDPPLVPPSEPMPASAHQFEFNRPTIVSRTANRNRIGNSVLPAKRKHFMTTHDGTSSSHNQDHASMPDRPDQGNENTLPAEFPAVIKAFFAFDGLRNIDSRLCP